jgi:hypothetical protein
MKRFLIAIIILAFAATFAVQPVRAQSLTGPVSPAGVSSTTGALKSNGAGVVSQAAASDLSNGTTGSGVVVLATSPTLAGSVAVGTNASSGDDSAVLALRTATNPLSSGGSHAFRDEGVYQQSSGSGGYASYDCVVQTKGSLADNHTHCFQSRPHISITNTVSDVSGLTHQPTVDVGATVANSYGFQMLDAINNGTLTNQYGMWCPVLVHGTNNYCFYNGGAALNYMGTGLTQIGSGGTLEFTGFSTYGAIFSHDSSGVALDNPNLTIVNGVLTLASSAQAEVLASAHALTLASTSSDVVLTPGSRKVILNGGIVAGGSAPTLTGTCTTASQVGGNTAGKFTATCTAQTVIIALPTAPNGWVCNTHDITTVADILAQTAYSTTSCTVTGTTVASDVIVFDAIGF